MSTPSTAHIIATALARNDHPDADWDDLSPAQKLVFETAAMGVEDALDVAGVINDVKHAQAEALENAARSVAARASGVSTWIMEEAAAVRAGTQNKPPQRNDAAIAVITSVLDEDWRVQAQYPSSVALAIVRGLEPLLKEPNESVRKVYATFIRSRPGDDAAQWIEARLRVAEPWPFLIETRKLGAYEMARLGPMSGDTAVSACDHFGETSVESAMCAAEAATNLSRNVVLIFNRLDEIVALNPGMLERVNALLRRKDGTVKIMVASDSEVAGLDAPPFDTWRSAD